MSPDRVGSDSPGGSTARLEEAMAVHRAALEERTRERVPLGWATTQKSLGIALQVLGRRESGTARLEEGVAAFEACLMVAVSVWPPEAFQAAPPASW